MKTRAAVAWEAGKPLQIEEIDIAGPKAGEVLIQIKATGVCHTDAFTLSGRPVQKMRVGLFGPAHWRHGADRAIDGPEVHHGVEAALQILDCVNDLADALAGAVMAELPELKLERARFIVQVETDETSRTAEGIDTAEFWVQTNPGTRPGPMMKVASGGELSRFLLALKVALADRGSAPTLVFDEIDTGVGGAVADAIGQRLARLSARVQVLSVTHAPQVAARAATHYLISKAGDAEKVATRIAAMDRKQRAEELARMLAGASITDEARAAAERLLAENAAAG